ncbi:PAS domain S-box protein [Haloarchaeobius amylolyticus]|uniref:PAS domain S-box protein n=1 Tax=Haloarchaeobius amylolyticus TaxID=1198296 RepID=UPI00226E2F3F|nr:PAS domain S-box protein [Haloarchaeobius amylolyticus]
MSDRDYEYEHHRAESGLESVMTRPLSATADIRVLHVDDDRDLGEATAAFLAKIDDDLDVVTETDPEQALARLDDGIDCIVSDYEMPEMDGLTFLERLRERYETLPFILFTGKGSEEIAAKAVSAGANGYIRKEGGTGQFTVLANMIREAVSKVRAETNYREIFRATAEGILIVDPGTGIVLDANPGACELLRRDAHELVGRALGDLSPDYEPHTPETLAKWLERTVDEGSQKFEWQVVDGSGDLVWTEMQFNPTRLGGRERVLALLRDISDRKFREHELRRREQELEEAEERYQLVVSNVEDYAICELDPEGYITSWNDTAARITGFSTEEAIGTHLSLLYTEEDAQKDLPTRLLAEAAREGRSEDEGWRVRRDGSRFWANVVISKLQVGDGQARFEALTRDRTRERERETQLTLAEERYQQLVEQNLVGIYVIQDGVFAYVNPRLAEIFGYDPDELHGTDPLDLVAEEYREEVADRLQRRIEERLQGIEYRFEAVRKDGEHVLVEVHGNYIEYEGQPAVMGSLIDVTDHAERQQELERYQRIFEAMGDGVYKLDLEGRITDCNRAAEDISGYDREELVGEHVSIVMNDADIGRCERGIHELLTVGEERVKRYEIDIRHRDGHTVPCELNLTVLPLGPHGELRGTVGIVRDISERKERQRRYEAIFNQTYQFTGLLDPDGTMLEANETALEFGGLDRADVVGQKMWETAWFADDEDTQERLRGLVERAAAGEFVRCEMDVHGPEDVAVTDFSIKPVTDDDGAVVLLIPEARDITERVRIERELRESRRKFSTLLSNLPGTAYRCANRPDWPTEFISEGCLPLTGYPREAFESGEVSWGGDVIHPEDRDDVWETVQTALCAHEPFELNYRIVTRDGEVRWAWEQGEGVFDEDGRLEALEGFITDVTERHRMEQEVRAGEQALRELTDVASSVDLTFEEKLPRILAIGCDRLDVENGHLTRVQQQSDLREILAVSDDHAHVTEGAVMPLSETFCADTIDAGETICVHLGDADESPFATYVGTPVVANGEVYGTLCFVDCDPRDPLTDAERSFVALVAQWIRFELERAEYERQLERENDRLEDFASIVSHDLRNPLDIIAITLELLRQDGDLSRLDAIERATVRMNELIDDLLELTRQGKVVGETSVVDVEAVARRAWENVDTAAATLSVEPGLGELAADEPRLLQVFENLFRNSVEHGIGSDAGGLEAARPGVTEDRNPDGGQQAAGDTLSIRVGPLDTEHGFFVEDDGVGIPPGQRDRVFDHGHTTSEAGTGFGLSIVRDIVEAHKWQIRATESESGGARFEVREQPAGVVGESAVSRSEREE